MNDEILQTTRVKCNRMCFSRDLRLGLQYTCYYIYLLVTHHPVNRQYWHGQGHGQRGGDCLRWSRNYHGRRRLGCRIQPKGEPPIALTRTIELRTRPKNTLIAIVGKTNPRALRTYKAIAIHWLGGSHQTGVTFAASLLGCVNEIRFWNRVQWTKEFCFQVDFLTVKIEECTSGANVPCAPNFATVACRSHGSIVFKSVEWPLNSIGINWSASFCCGCFLVCVLGSLESLLGFHFRLSSVGHTGEWSLTKTVVFGLKKRVDKWALWLFRCSRKGSSD